MPKTLSDGDIMLVPLNADHAKEYIALANHPDIGWRINQPQPFEQKHFDDLIEKVQSKPRRYTWMIMRQNEICGGINFAPATHTKLYQGGYWLHPEHWGKGIAAQALKLVCDFLFNDLKVERVQAVVEPGNPPSIRVLEKCGFIREGLLHKFYPSRQRGLLDVYMYGKVKV
jgi:RimJ/RimL family protein N-acetyltransferase